ncbi:hypothetical protein [Plantactinospora sp. WMMB782]|uniref:hypothetical protein n=1 Tax=Plantactinospora sp. WMMB782 TaxID=3404121 RepID=UPI003B92B0F8
MYADVETFLAAWLGAALDIKTWADPDRDPGWRYEAPLAHILRAPGEGDGALTLDSALVDIDVYAVNADNARTTAERIRKAIRVTLPGHTTSNGVSVQGTQTTMAPIWTPDPKVKRRSATYRIFLHNPGL